MKKWFKYLLVFSLILAPIFTLSACGKSTASQNTVRLGIVGDQDKQVWNPIAQQLKKKNINLKLIEFSDYSQPNAALQNHEIDANAFQHHAFLDNWNQAHHSNIVSIGNTHIEPLAIYSQKIKNIKQLKNGSQVTLPNDATNEGRALHLLQAAGLIKVNPNKGLPTTKDITQNNKHLKFVALDASQTPRSLNDTDAAIINANFAIDAKLNPKEALFKESTSKYIKPYINFIATNKSDRNNKKLKEVVKAYQSKDNAKRLDDVYHGAQIPAWNIKLK